MSSTTANQETPKKVDLGLLEEDDEFEEFPAEGKFECACFTIRGSSALSSYIHGNHINLEKTNESCSSGAFQNGPESVTPKRPTYGKTTGMTTTSRMIFRTSCARSCKKPDFSLNKHKMLKCK